MSAEIFFTLFSSLASGPGGVQKLRDIVLKLAVRGRLVPQDPLEGDAELALSTIVADADPLLRKRFEKYETPDPIFEVPPNWRWTAIGKMSRDWGQKVPDGPFQYIDVGGIDNIRGEIGRGLQVLQPEEAPSRARKLVSQGTVIYSTVRPYLKNIAIVDRLFSPNPIVSTAFAVVHPLGGILPEFVFYYLRSPDFVTHVESQMMGVAYPAINDGKFFAAPIPIPPIGEQRRIVAKVKELTALCDRLDVQQTDAVKLKREAAASALYSLVESKASEDITRHWAMLTQNFGELFDDFETIKALREAIRILAVKGKLGTQNADDETTAQMLERVGRLPPPARYSKRSNERIPGRCGLSINPPSLDLPKAWEWVPLVEIARLESGHTPSRTRPEWWGGDISWMGLVDARLHDEGTIYETVQKTNEDGIENSAARLLPAGTVCFSRTASVGYVVILGNPMATSQDFVNWVPTEAVTSEWLQLVMVAERGSIDKFSKGAVHQTIYYPAWLSMHIALPPLKEQKRIVTRVQELLELCDRLEQQIARGDQLNSELMASLLEYLNDPPPSDGGNQVLFESGTDVSIAAFSKSGKGNVSQGTLEKSGRIARPLNSVRQPTYHGLDADEKVKEAALVAAIIKAFFVAGGEPIGNFRLQKAVYFARRKMGEHAGEMAYLKKVAGPYNPSMKYSGGIAVAKHRSWLREARGRFGFGHMPGPEVGQAGELIERYGFGEPASWVAGHFRYKKNEEWEMLATVDYTIEHLRMTGHDPDARKILQYIANDSEWSAKIEKLNVTEFSVQSAVNEIKCLFED